VFLTNIFFTIVPVRIAVNYAYVDVPEKSHVLLPGTARTTNNGTVAIQKKMFKFGPLTKYRHASVSTHSISAIYRGPKEIGKLNK
jgi:hypothetical protein